MRDFECGCSEYCSTILVNALLCLTTRFTRAETTDGQSLLDETTWDDTPFDEALAMVQNGSLSLRLADVQALGILSLYQISRGRVDLAARLKSRLTNATLDR